MKRIFKSLRNLGWLLLGIAILPIFLIAQFGRLKVLFGGMFSGLDFVSLNEKAHRKRLTFRQLISTPSLDTAQGIQEEVRALIAADSWLALSNQMMTWDQDRCKCEAGRPHVYTAMETAIQSIARGGFEGHHCHPDVIYDISDEMTEMLETKAAIHSDSYPLWALAAIARCHQGWLSRGHDYAEYVSDTAWFGMSTRFNKARWLLDRFDPVALNAPLLAAARHGLLAFMPDAEKHVHQYYEEWSTLDPFDQTPHRAHGTMMLPRWFGDGSMLAVEAQKAAQRTAKETGDAAYFSMYASAFMAWDPDVLHVDFDILAKGAHDLISLRGQDPSFVARLLQEMVWWTPDSDYAKAPEHLRDQADDITRRIKELRNDILRTRLTAVHGHSWDNGVRGAIDEISALFQPEIKEGHATFALTEQGLVITPGEDGSH